MNIKNLYKGRLSRKKYLVKLLLLGIPFVLIGAFLSVVLGNQGLAQMIITYATLPILLSLMVRRFHDIGISGKPLVIYVVIREIIVIGIFFINEMFVTDFFIFPNILSFILLLNMALGLYTLLAPGQQEKNMFDLDPVDVKHITKETTFIHTSPKITPMVSPKNIGNKITPSVIALFLVVGLIGSAFYWFQYRPSKIRQDCSWVEEKTEAVPYKPAMTVAEMKSRGMLDDCESYENAPEWTKKYLDLKLCEAVNEATINDNSVAKEAVPAKSWWRKATTKEYEFCLHSKGL